MNFLSRNLDDTAPFSDRPLLLVNEPFHLQQSYCFVIIYLFNVGI